METYAKPLPHALEAEEAVIGSILLDQNQLGDILQVLTPEDFYHRLHSRIYTAILKHVDQNQTLDPVLLLETVRVDGQGSIDLTTIVRLMTTVPAGLDLETQVELIRDRSLIRKLIRGMNKVINVALSQDHPTDTVFDAAEEIVYGLRSHEEQVKACLVSEAMVEYLNKVRSFNPQSGGVVGLHTHYLDLDFKLKGLRPGQYIVVAGRPSIGKTSFITRMLYNTVVKSDTPCLMFSLEMAAEEIYERILAAETNIDSSKLRTNDLTAADWTALDKIPQELRRPAGLYINDSPSITTRTIRSEIRRVNGILSKQGKQLGMIAVDHIGLMRNEQHLHGRTREGEVSEISKTLKQIGREFNLTVVALSQLNRQSESRSDHKPAVSDLRESGSIEQDADVVILLYREDHYQTDTTLHTKIADVIVGKNRNGPTGVIQLYFERKSTRFSNLIEGSVTDFPIHDHVEDNNLIF